MIAPDVEGVGDRALDGAAPGYTDCWRGCVPGCPGRDGREDNLPDT